MALVISLMGLLARVALRLFARDSLATAIVYSTVTDANSVVPVVPASIVVVFPARRRAAVVVVAVVIGCSTISKISKSLLGFLRLSGVPSLVHPQFPEDFLN